MKRKVKREPHKLQLTISWSNSYYIDWVARLEKLLRKKPHSVRIEIIGNGEVPADAALLIRAALLERSAKTRIFTNARSTLQNGSVMIWLLGDERAIRDDAKIFFRRADLTDDAEINPNSNWRNESTYEDSFSEVDPDEGDQARVLQVINEFLPVKEFAGRLIGVAVLKQFGLVDNARVDGFLASAFGKSNRAKQGIAFR